MKLSKTRWPIVAFGILITLILASLGTAQAQQVREGNQLASELSLAEQSLNKTQLEQLSYQQKELEKQLAQTLSQFETAKAELSRPIDSITASDALFGIALASGVEITEFSSQSLTDGDLAGLTCLVLPITVEVEGDVPSLVSFIIKLNGDLANGLVKSAKISVPEASSKDKPSANIELVIYTYQGD